LRARELQIQNLPGVSGEKIILPSKIDEFLTVGR